MTCNCRASALRIFVQSLTRVQLSGATQRQAHLLDPKAFGAYTSSGSLRGFAATSATCYPRQSQRVPAHTKADLYGQVEQSHDTSDPSQTTSFAPPAAEASASQVDQAKGSHAIFDLSPEAIDALAAGLRRTPIEQDPSDNSNVGYQDEADVPVRRKAELSGSSRLKRSKIMPADSSAWEHADPPARKRENWQIQKDALKEKFPEGWNPRKKLSPDALDGIRALHTQYPQIYTTQALANQFQVSAEAIRRILRSKWKPSTEEEEDRQQRWFNRGKNIWSQMAELGTKPPKKWRQAGVERDARFSKKKSAKSEYPYVPKWKEKESNQRKLGDSIL